MSKLELEKSVLFDFFIRLPMPNKYPYAEYLVPVPTQPVLTKKPDLVLFESPRIETLKFTNMRFIEIGFAWTFKKKEHLYVWVLKSKDG
jgi:hypothetical protein